MITEKDVWYTYQTLKGKKVEYPSGKKWEGIYSKLTQENRNNIYILTKYLNTKWQSINLEKYLSIGFLLWKSFSYKYFLREEIINKYIQLDKLQKRKEVTNKSIKESVEFIIYNRYPLWYYGQLKDKEFSLPINDYLHGYIDSVVIVYMIDRGYLNLEHERFYIPYIIDRYEELKEQVDEKKDLLLRLEGVIMSKQEDKERYLQDPEKKKKNGQDEDVEEKLLYGDEETMEEKKRKKKEYQEKQLNE